MITLYSTAGGPNGFKVAVVLEELGVPYETKWLQFPEIKGEDHVKLNPNGRIPTIIDHDNDDLVLWESNAIIQYLVERYDKDHKLSFVSGPEKYHVNQWLWFQGTGQGPYYGQATWFNNFHSEKIPSAIERYQAEVERVIGVLDKALAGKNYLVGDKLTVADLSFVPWGEFIPIAMKGKEYDFSKYANWTKWHKEMVARSSVQKVLEDKKTLV